MKTILNIRRISTTLAAAAAVVGLLLSAALAGAGPALHHASGHHVFGGGNFLDCKSGNEFMFTVKALQLPKDRVKGRLQFHNLDKPSSIYMKIVRLEFLSDATVGLIGEVTDSDGANVAPGDCRAIKLQDSGKGKNAEKDRASKLFNPKVDPFTCAAVVIDWEAEALDPIKLNNGNIWVR